MAELRYNCTLSFGMSTNARNIQVSQMAQNKRISIDQANALIEEIQSELRYAITLERMVELRRLVNPYVGIIQGTLGKRKYVRKANIEVIDTEIVTEVIPIIEKVKSVELYGLLTNIGEVVSTIKGGTQGDYRIISVPNKQHVRIVRTNEKNDNDYTDYSISAMNESLKFKRWTVTNPSKELLAMIQSNTNVVKSKDFKRDNSQKNDQYNHSMGNSYVINIKNGEEYVANIPITPGFTGNCQLSVIGYMNTLMSVTTDLVGQLKEIYNVAGRRLLLCDVKSNVAKNLEAQLNPKSINNKMPYNSTNGSNMVIMLIDLSKL